MLNSHATAIRRLALAVLAIGLVIAVTARPAQAQRFPHHPHFFSNPVFHGPLSNFPTPSGINFYTRGLPPSTVQYLNSTQ